MDLNSIRARTDDDLDECVRILGRVHDCGGYPVNWPSDPTEWLRGMSDSAWVATVDGACVGHVAIAVDAGAAFVERLFVDPARSGSGTGRALLRYAAARARSLAADVLLDVVAADDAANGLYRAEGWSEVSRAPISWGATPTSMLVRFRAPGGQ